MKIDYIYPSKEIWHDTWSTGKGWVLTMERMRVLQHTFAVNLKNHTDIFEYARVQI